MTDDGSDLRRELGAFLRARRERTEPADVGLPGSSRRRTPGLRREEVAALAGISTTWYTFLEQGRDVRASDQVLGAIASALRLGDAERAHLRAVATGDRAPVEDVEQVAPEVAAIPGLVDPNPAYVTGSSFDLLAWNDAADVLFAGVSAGERPNLVRWMFLAPAAREVLPDWTVVAQSLLARLRANAGRHPDSDRFRRLEHELRTGSPDADAWWVRYDIGANQTGVKRIRRPDGREQQLAHTSFLVADRPDQTLTIYRPV